MKSETYRYKKTKRYALQIPVLVTMITCILHTGIIVCKLIWSELYLFDVIAMDVITLISIAVSVWIGITISNSIDQNRIRKIEIALHNARETRKFLLKRYNELEKQIENYIIQHREYNFGIFLAEVSLFDDQLAIYLVNKISKKLNPQIYFELYLLENKYSEILNIQNKKNLSAEQKIDKIECFLNQIKSTEEHIERFMCEDCNIQNYLQYRKADCKFFSGYIYLEQQKHELCAENFQKASKLYVQIIKDVPAVKKLERNLSLYNLYEINKHLFSIDPSFTLQDFEFNEKKFLAYVVNMIGESNSKTVEAINQISNSSIATSVKTKYSYSKIVKRAVGCFFVVEQLIDTSALLQKEVYYRNYGWALLRVYSNEIDSKEFENALSYSYKLFRKAYNLNKDNPKIYNAILYSYAAKLSYHINIEWCECFISKLTAKEKKVKIEESLFDLENANNSINIDCIDEIVESTKNFHKISTNKFPENGNFDLYYLWVVCLAKIYHLENQISYTSLNEIREMLKQIKENKIYNNVLFEAVTQLVDLTCSSNLILF